jgi:glutathione synthase/RimK-type ligase-like ATP-grasp enzyme
MIVVTSHERDEHAAGVVGRLRSTGHPVALVDTAAYPQRTTLSLHYDGAYTRGVLTSDGQPIRVEEVGAVWWRRPQPYELDPELDASASSFAFTECHEAISGMWHSLDAAWVNPPASDEVAHHKPLQLARAQEVGLQVPRTLVTNDPDEARSFVDSLGPGRTVYKTFVATEENWRETRLVRSDEIALLDAVRLAPVIFQEYVEAEADLRVTVIGDQLWPTRIVPGRGSYAVDYRMDLGAAEFSPTHLPDDVAEKLMLLMKRLDLVYGAVDLRRTAEGEHVFLEVNPAGEWLFVEERTGQPLTEAMADLLVSLDRKGAA